MQTLKDEGSMSFTEELTFSLTQTHDKQIIPLCLNNHYFEREFVLECIEEVGKLLVRKRVGEQPNALEKLALALLCDSAGIPTSFKG